MYIQYKFVKEYNIMWAYESVFYQIYPLGFCGAPFENDGVEESRILKVIDWIPHIRKLGADAIYFSPVFESDTHGYNTRDYCKIDTRLGTNEDFKQVCDALDQLPDQSIFVLVDLPADLSDHTLQFCNLLPGAFLCGILKLQLILLVP